MDQEYEDGYDDSLCNQNHCDTYRLRFYNLDTSKVYETVHNLYYHTVHIDGMEMLSNCKCLSTCLQTSILSSRQVVKYKMDTATYSDLFPLQVFCILHPELSQLQLAASIDDNIRLYAYNGCEIKQ